MSAQFSNVIVGEQFLKQIDETRQCIKKLTIAQNFVVSEKKHIKFTRDSLQRLEIANLQQGSAVVFDMIFLACQEAEKVAPGSSEVIMRLFDSKDLINSKIELRKIIESNIQIPSSLALSDVLTKTMSNEFLTTIVHHAITLAGLGGRIIVENSTNFNSLELSNGYTFPCLASHLLCDQKNIWTATKVKPIIIDGKPDTVGEIHNILEAAAQTKEQIVIVARGFSNDVLSTIISNTLQKRVNILPVIVSLGLETINTLKDIAVACGTDMISSLKGDLISAIDISQLASIDLATCSGNSLIIQNAMSANDVAFHISNLVNQRKKQSIVDMQDLIDKRIRTLSATTVTIKIKREFNECVSEGLRISRAVLERGTIDLQLLKTLPGFELVSELGVWPTSAFIVGLEHVQKLQTLINSSEAFVYSI